MKGKKSVNEKTADWMDQIIRWMAFAGILIVLVLNLFYTTTVGDSEAVTIAGSSWQWIPAAALLLAVLVFWAFLSEKIREKRLFAVLTVFYLIAGCYFIFNIDPVIRDDAKAVYDTAVSMGNGDYSSMAPGNYLYVYPNQIGLVMYDRIVRVFSEQFKFLEVLNLLQVIGINYFTYKCSDLCFGQNRKINNLTILLTFAFLPQLFFLMFKYGLIPGFFFMSGCFYFLLVWLRKHRLLFLIGSVLFGTVAACVKMNYLIGMIAVAVILVIRGIRDRKWRYWVSAAVFLIASVGGGKALRIACEQETGMSMSSGIPLTFWVIMGTDIDNVGQRGPGWYNSIGWRVMDANDYDVEKSSGIARQMLKDNLQKMAAEPGRTAEFFKDKTVSLWCDPLYESVWSGVSQWEASTTGCVRKELLRSLYCYETAEQVSIVFMKGLLMILTAGAAVFLIRHMRQHRDLLYAPLYFLGGFLFHIFWEAKSQYVYTYIFVLIPLCAFEISCLSEWAVRYAAVRRRRRRRTAGKKQGKVR